MPAAVRAASALYVENRFNRFTSLQISSKLMRKRKQFGKAQSWRPIKRRCVG